MCWKYDAAVANTVRSLQTLTYLSLQDADAADLEIQEGRVSMAMEIVDDHPFSRAAGIAKEEEERGTPEAGYVNVAGGGREITPEYLRECVKSRNGGKKARKK